MTSETAPKRCRQCLLRDMVDEDGFYRDLLRYRSVLSEEVRTPDGEYEARLLARRECGRRSVSLITERAEHQSSMDGMN